MQTPAETTARETSVTLPTFNSESAGDDATAWCKTANMILTEHPLEGSALVMTLSKSLAESASQWLSQICYVGMTWPQFQELFTHRYESADMPAAILFNLLNGRPSANECLSVYCSRLVTSLMAKWSSMTVGEMAVSLVMAHASQIDTRLQSLLYTKTIKTRSELQQQLKAYAFGKREECLRLDSGPERKKQKMQAPVIIVAGLGTKSENVVRGWQTRRAKSKPSNRMARR